MQKRGLKFGSNTQPLLCPVLGRLQRYSDVWQYHVVAEHVRAGLLLDHDRIHELCRCVSQADRDGARPSCVLGFFSINAFALCLTGKGIP